MSARDKTKISTEIYQDNINKTYGTKFTMPVTYGDTAAEAGLDGQVIRTKKLEETAAKK